LRIALSENIRIKSHANGGTMQDFLNLMLILSVVGVPTVIMFTKFARPW
jgi:hypothetical protein